MAADAAVGREVIDDFGQQIGEAVRDGGGGQAGLLCEFLNFVGAEHVRDLVAIHGQILARAHPRGGVVAETFGGELLQQALKSAVLAEEVLEEREKLVGDSAGVAATTVAVTATERAECLTGELIEETHERVWFG